MRTSGVRVGCVPVRRRASWRSARHRHSRRTSRTDRDDQVVITGNVDVRSGESVDRVLIFDGDVRVNGVVQDWVFAFNGDVVVDGRVNDDVTALNGRVVGHLDRIGRW